MDRIPDTLTDDLIDAHLALAYQTSGLNGGMCGEAWDRIVARRFFGLGVGVGTGLIPLPNETQAKGAAQ